MSDELTRVLILVETYPTLSEKYAELVCTAGVKEDGSWIRIYPVPYRRLSKEKRYHKYHWIEAPLIRNTSDKRFESYKVSDISRITLLDSCLSTKNGWKERKDFLFSKVKIWDDLQVLIQCSRETDLSLAMFKPKSIENFIIEPTEREWDQEKYQNIMRDIKEPSLFDSDEDKLKKETFKIAEKLPYKFFYQFTDSKETKHKMMIEDWEIGQLYWNTLADCNGDEECAIKKVKQKYFDEFVFEKDLYLFLGTTKQFHNRGKNPFIIIGMFYPPKNTNPTLFEI